MRLEIILEIGDRVVADNNKGTAYDEYRGKAGIVIGQNSRELGVKFDDGTFARFSRSMHVLRPENLHFSKHSIR